MRRLILAALLMIAGLCPAFAQSPPKPPFSTGTVLTAGQWNALFASKQDWLGQNPLLVTGGTLTGPLYLPGSTASASSFRITQGTEPTSPVDGDIWTTSAGMYVRIDGATVGPLGAGGGGGAVTSVAAANTTVTVTPTTGDVTVALNLSTANTWVGAQSFAPTGLVVRGASSGTGSLRFAGVAGTSVLTFPAGTTDFSATGGTSQVVKQTSAGGAFTVARLACADLSDAAATCATSGLNASNISSGTLPFARLDVATATNIWANTASKVVDAAGLNAAGALTSLTSGTNIAVDMGAGINFTVSLAHNATLGAPSGTVAGRSGCIMIVQTGGSNTMAFNAVWKFAGGIDPTLSTAAGAVDMLCYIVRDSSNILATMTLSMS